MSNVDFSKLNIPLKELQDYIDAERKAQKKAEEDESQAYRDRLLRDRETKAQAEREAEAAARAAGDPNIKAARVLADMLGDRLNTFVSALSRINPAKFVAELLKLHGEQETKARHARMGTAHVDRFATQAAVVAARKTRVDGELIRLGILDVTPDEDETR